MDKFDQYCQFWEVHCLFFQLLSCAWCPVRPVRSWPRQQHSCPLVITPPISLSAQYINTVHSQPKPLQHV